MNSLLDYYRMKTDTDTDTIYFQKVKEEDIKIYGKSLNEVITILNGLELEKITNIEMTMENLSYLYRELLKEQYKVQTESIKRMFDIN